MRKGEKNSILSSWILNLHIIISKNIHRNTFSFSHCMILTLVNSNSNSRQSCNLLVSANASPLKNRALHKSLTSRHFNLTHQSVWLACKPFTFLYWSACFFFSFFSLLDTSTLCRLANLVAKLIKASLQANSRNKRSANAFLRMIQPTFFTLQFLKNMRCH